MGNRRTSRKPRKTSALSQATLADATRRAAAKRAASSRHLEQNLAEIPEQSQRQKAGNRYAAAEAAEQWRENK